jgi:hypothetical protein
MPVPLGADIPAYTQPECSSLGEKTMEKPFAVCSETLSLVPVDGTMEWCKVGRWKRKLFQVGADAVADLALRTRRMMKSGMKMVLRAGPDPLRWQSQFVGKDVAVRLWIESPKGATVVVEPWPEEKAKPLHELAPKQRSALEKVLRKRKYRARGAISKPYGKATVASLINA